MIYERDDSMLYERLVQPWLTNDEAAFRGSLKQFTVIYLLSLVPWGAGAFFTVGWYLMGRFPYPAPDWVAIPTFLILIYPVVVLICLGGMWFIWRQTKAQERVMKWVWWPLLILLLGSGGVVTDLLLYQFDVELHDFEWAMYIDKSISLPLNELASEGGFRPRMYADFSELGVPLDVEPEDVVMWGDESVVFVTEWSVEEIEQFYRDVIADQYGEEEVEVSVVDGYTQLQFAPGFSSNSMEIYIGDEWGREEVLAGRVVGLVSCFGLGCGDRDKLRAWLAGEEIE
ncbi:MAG TPA: hypothetical protein VLL52_00430 [Anaerolineae bacterium]|nr:hypothetical protein [Anaerolineae bacterium]